MDSQTKFKNNKASAIIFSALAVFVAAIYFGFFHKNTVPKFTIDSLISSTNGTETTAFSQINFRVSPEVSEAINNGVPVYIVIEHAFSSQGLIQNNYHNKRIQQHRLERHALSDKYILSGVEEGRLQNFDSISAALTYLGQSFNIKRDNPNEYSNLAIRAYIDLKQLPNALRFQHLFSKAWLHDSGWSVWPLKS